VKVLGLFRHAKSSWEDVGVRDFDRGLNSRGRKGAALMGQHIARHGIKWDQVIASPATRVRETLDGAIEAAKSCPPITWDDRIYLASSETLVDVLREKGHGSDAILLCGHNPGLQELVFDLARENSPNPLLDKVAGKFPTAAFAVIELDIGEWADLDLHSGRLVHLARPRDLDPSLGPEAVDH
jgi:phosphohistidine phosphatase